MERYARQTIFAGIGEEGQRRLLAGRAVVVGCGALGTVIANVLARAGVGRLRLIDRDYVELTNLQRQVLYTEADVQAGLPKALVAAERLRAANSEIAVEPVVADLNPDNAERLLRDADVVLDGADNFETRYLVNDVCVKHGIPWVYAAAIASYGVLMPVLPGETACLRCVFVEQPAPGTVATCDTAGVIAPSPGAIGNLAAAEALKLLVGARDRLNRGLLWLDVWHNSYQQTPISAPVPGCPTCDARRFEFLAGRGSRATTLCGRDAVQVRPASAAQLDLAALAERLAPLGAVHQNDYLLRFRTDGYELTVFPDARAIVKGTSDEAVARSLYARFIGL